MKQPRIVFFGNSAFSVTILDALVRAQCNVVTVITSPDEPKGRGHVPTSPLSALYAKEHNLPLVQASRVSSSDISPCEIGVIASYGHIIPNDILDIPTHGTLNVHPSLLPRYRGPTPIQTALACGDTATGTTIMLTDKEIDHGPIIAQQKIAILPTDDAITLEQKLALASAELLVRAIPAWIAGTIQARAQDHAQATFTKLLTKESGHIDWQRSACDIVNNIRAYTVWPTCWNTLGTLRLKILRGATTLYVRPHAVAPGTLYDMRGKFLVAAQDFFVELELIQPESRIPMTGRVFLAGLRDEFKGKMLR